MKQERFLIHKIPAILYGIPTDKVYLFLHGQGGSKEEAAAFSEFACARGWQVLSIDLPEHGERTNEADALTPWQVVPELKQLMAFAKANWSKIALRANSIGAWFSMLSFDGEPLKQCLFVSPILDMPALIQTMMGWAGVTESQLEAEKTIPTTFGQTLSWEYWTYAQLNPITHWDAPTELLYGERDSMTPRQIVDAFAKQFSCHVTVMENGEHWFHTPQQLAFLDTWTKELL